MARLIGPQGGPPQDDQRRSNHRRVPVGSSPMRARKRVFELAAVTSPLEPLARCGFGVIPRARCHMS